MIQDRRDPVPHPERAAELGVRQLGGQLEVLEADALPGPLVPGEQHGQLEGGHLQVVLAHLVLKGDLGRRERGGGGGGEEEGVNRGGGPEER